MSNVDLGKDIYINFNKQDYDGYRTIDAKMAAKSSSGFTIKDGQMIAKSIQDKMNKKYENLMALSADSSPNKNNVSVGIVEWLREWTFGFISGYFASGKNGNLGLGFSADDLTKSGKIVKQIFQSEDNITASQFKDRLNRTIKAREKGKNVVSFQNSKGEDIIIDELERKHFKDTELAKLKNLYNKLNMNGKNNKTGKRLWEEQWQHLQQVMGWIKSRTTAQGEIFEKIVAFLATGTVKKYMSNMENIFNTETTGQNKSQGTISSGSGGVGSLIKMSTKIKNTLTDVILDKSYTSSKNSATLQVSGIRGRYQIYANTPGIYQQKADIVITADFFSDDNDKEIKNKVGNNTLRLSAKNYIGSTHYHGMTAANLLFVLDLLDLKSINTIGNILSVTNVSNAPSDIQGVSTTFDWSYKNDIINQLLFLSLYQGMSGATQQNYTQSSSSNFLVINGTSKKLHYHNPPIQVPQVKVLYIPYIISRMMITNNINTMSSLLDKGQQGKVEKMKEVSAQRNWYAPSNSTDRTISYGFQASADTYAQLLSNFAKIGNLKFQIPVSNINYL